MHGTASELADALHERYLVERELGRGGMATVYLAEGLKHDREVAVRSCGRSSLPPWDRSGSCGRSRSPPGCRPVARHRGCQPANQNVMATAPKGR
jgi:hypothetical protein